MIISRVVNISSSVLMSLLLMYSIAISAAPAEDDLLLLVVPSVIAASQNGSEQPSTAKPLDKIKELSGDWIFDYLDFSEEFRFKVSTAKVDTSDSQVATIDGAEYVSGFSIIIANNLYGAYDARDQSYAVFHQWGPPTYDSGSMYFFRSTSKNTPGYDCHFYTDGDGNIDDYYQGYGGSLACESLSKHKYSAQAQARQAARYVDPELGKAAKYQIILDRRSRLSALNGNAPVEHKVSDPYQRGYNYIRSHIPDTDRP